MNRPGKPLSGTLRERLPHPYAWVATLGLLALGAGMVLAVRDGTPPALWKNAGFVLTGTITGVGTFTGAIHRILNRRRKSQHKEAKRKLLRSIGHDCIGAISRSFGQDGLPGFTYGGRELNSAWSYGIEAGKVCPEGLRDAVFRQYEEAVYTDEERQAGRPPRRRTVLTDDCLNLHMAQVIVTRALAAARAYSALFDSKELPARALELATATLGDGKESGKLDDFQGALLIMLLLESAETCGRLLWQLGGVVKRKELRQNYGGRE